MRRYALEQAMGGKDVYYFTLERRRLQVLPLASTFASRPGSIRLAAW
jgi:hypothetical protein